MLEETASGPAEGPAEGEGMALPELGLVLLKSLRLSPLKTRKGREFETP